ncbi:efflux RND transporter periplasmic adaptor subunit [Thalassotalea ganghwensis]
MTEESINRPTLLKTLILCLIILMITAGFILLIFSTEPEPTKETATKRSAMLVEVIPVTIGDFVPKINAMGVVVPAQSIALTSQVSGKIKQISEQFVPGQFIQQGETLAQIEKSDYQLQLQQRENQVIKANAALQIELGEQEVAKKIYTDLEQDLPASSRALMLREPQLKQARANVQEAELQLAQAKLELERTALSAPFDAYIQRKLVSLGSHVSKGDAIAQLVGVDQYWIEAAIPTEKLSAISIAQESNIEVNVTDRLAWRNGQSRMGKLISLLPLVDDTSRMAKVLISVDDPLDIEQTKKPKLTLGAYVSVDIPTIALNQVAKIERQWLRKNETIWLMEDGKLAIRPLNIVFRDQEFVYVKDSLKVSDNIVTTDLSRVKEGLSLRVAGQVDDEK